MSMRLASKRHLRLEAQDRPLCKEGSQVAGQVSGGSLPMTAGNPQLLGPGRGGIPQEGGLVLTSESRVGVLLLGAGFTQEM